MKGTENWDKTEVKMPPDIVKYSIIPGVTLTLLWCYI